MTERILAIPTSDGSMETFVAHPDTAAACPVVVVYMDAPGIREELRDFARRIADQGYFAVLPDLYYRSGRVRIDFQEEGGREAALTHMRTLSNAGVAADTRALLAALERESAAAKGPKGCIGYCMSGQFIVTVAGTFPEHFRASISCYGVGIVTDADDSPHRLIPRIQGEIFFAFADKDDYVPAPVIETLRETLDENGTDHQLETYPGTEHGFCFPERTARYVEAAAEDVWQRSFAMFERQLR